jgi:hypothetical protein
MLRDRWFADSPVEGTGFEPVWGFSCQVVVFGLLWVLCSARESRSSFFNRAAGVKRVCPIPALGEYWLARWWAPFGQMLFLCSAEGAVSSSRPEVTDRATRRGGQGRPQATAVGGASLTAASTARGSIRSGLSCYVQPGHGSFRGLLDMSSRNLASGRPAPLCPVRDQRGEACRNEERGVAVPRPSGTRYRLGSADFGSFCPGMVLRRRSAVSPSSGIRCDRSKSGA